MGYLLVEDFKDGLDTRKMLLTTKAGALLTATNVHITRGAEIEKRKAFVPFLNLPAGQTIGFQAASNNLYTYGGSSAPTMPPGISYQRLQHPSNLSLTKVLFNENFSGQIYAIARFSDGSVYHYYNGVRVTRWDALATTAINVSSVAISLALQIDQETPFTCTALGGVVTISGASNNVPFTATASYVFGGTINDGSMIEADIQSAGVSQVQISTVTVGGTVEAGDQYSITLTVPSTGYTKTFLVTGLASGMPTVVKTLGTKMYAVGGSLCYFCEIDNPINWGTDPDVGSPTFGTYINGAGVINMSTQDAGSDILTGLGIYQGKLAVIARRVIQIWSMDADPSLNALSQILSNMGTNAARSVLSYGDIDLFFSSDTGIRSVRARDASNAATISDVGTNIDTLFLANNQALSDTVKNDACAIIEPVDGRYWLAIDVNIYVYSFFPTPGVTAWSIYQPGFVISEMVYVNGRIYCRSGDTIYLYGGLDNKTYDSCPVAIDLPYLDEGKPAHEKTLTAFDVGQEGTTDVYIGSDVNFPTSRELIGTFTGSTYGLAKSLANNCGTHMGVRFESTYPGYLRIGNCAIHSNLEDD